MGLIWQEIECTPEDLGDIYPDRMSRAKVPGGWLIYIWGPTNGTHAITFYPDPTHGWEGTRPIAVEPPR